MHKRIVCKQNQIISHCMRNASGVTISLAWRIQAVQPWASVCFRMSHTLAPYGAPYIGFILSQGCTVLTEAHIIVSGLWTSVHACVWCHARTTSSSSTRSKYSPIDHCNGCTSRKTGGRTIRYSTDENPPWLPFVTPPLFWEYYKNLPMMI